MMTTENGASAVGSLEGIGSLPNLAPVHVYDHVYRLLRHALVSRKILPQARVVEAVLAVQLQVSRTPVRDALRRLESDGLLERGAKGSLAVVSFDAEEIRDLFLVRTVLDGLAAGLAAERSKPEDWDEVRRDAMALDQVGEQRGTDSYEFCEAHDRVHSAIYRLAFAPRMARLISERLMGLVEIAGGLSYRGDGPDEPVTAQHLDLVNEIASGDPDRARRASNEHVTEAQAATRLPFATNRAVDGHNNHAHHADVRRP